MKRTLRYRVGKRIGSAMLALALTVTVVPSFSGSALAEDSDFVISEEMVTEEMVTDAGSDSDTVDLVSQETDGETAGILEEEGILNILSDEDAGAEEDGTAVEEDGITVEEDDENEGLLEAADADAAKTDALMPQSEEPVPDDAAEEGDEDPGPAGFGGGNVEAFEDPELLAKMGITGAGAESDPDGLIYAADATINAVYNYTGTLPASAYSGISVTQNGSTVTVSVRGSLPKGYTFINLGVDFDPVLNINGKTTGTWTLNMSNYATGYHTVVVSLGNGTNAGVVGRKYMVSNTITDRPTSNGVFDVYSGYFDYYPYGSFSNNAGTLYMEYSADGGKTWQRSGYMKYSLITTASRQGYTISGLRAKTTYLTRIRYGEYVTYSADVGGDGKSYFFGGPVLNTTTIKTGSASKPSIKSVSLKATKVKYHKLRWPGYYNVVGGSVFWHNSYVERFYTAKVKVTVKLKKKPGTAGVFISLLGTTKWVKGNKKTYTVTFTPTYNYWVKNPHSGKYKLSVQVYSGQNKSWGGYSPVWSKKKKVT